MATATVVLIYVAVWAAIGFALDYLIGQVMPRSSLLIVGIAVAIALVYAVTPSTLHANSTAAVSQDDVACAWTY